MSDGIDATHAGLQKLYFACFTQPAKPLAELEAKLDDHKAYLGRLEEQGKLFAAGPLLSGGSYDGTGLIVYRAANLAEAQGLADGDPFHALGLRTYALWPWQVNEGSFEATLLYSTGRFRIG
jgi:uncharacterized protein